MTDSILDKKIMFYTDAKDVIGTMITLRQALTEIKEGKYKHHTDKLRNMPDKDERLEYKRKNLGAYVFQGTFSYREKISLIESSGILSGDIDVYSPEEAQKIKESLTKLPYVLMTCISPSGGVKVLLRIPYVCDDLEYKKYYTMAEQHLKSFNIKNDTSTKDICRFFFVTYDSDIYINENAEMMPLLNITSEEKVEKHICDENIPKYCAAIEEYIAEKELKTINETYSRHNYIDGNVGKYCYVYNKKDLYKKIKATQRRDDSAYNDTQHYKFSCGSLIKYFKENRIDEAFELCKECKHYKKYIEELKIVSNQIIIPGKGMLISDCAEALSKIQYEGIYYKPREKDVVEITTIEDVRNKYNSEYTGFKSVSSGRFINIIEKYVKTGFWEYVKGNGYEWKDKSLNTEQAKVILLNDCWCRTLPNVERIFSCPIPILYKNQLTFPNHGHDSRFKSYMPDNTPNIITDMPILEAKLILKKIYGEFCFKDKQSYTNAIAALFTPYCRGLYDKWNTRTPAFFFEANRERAGKDYCAVIDMLVMNGIATQDPAIATGDKNNNMTDEFRKKITTMLRTGRRRFHSTNNRGHIRNEAFEGIITSEYWADRLLGHNEEILLPNEMDFSLSGNIGYTASPDFINRCRFVRFHLEIEDANKRQFNTPNLHGWILQNRGLILSSLYACVREWFKADMPKGKTLFSSFPNWAEVVGGIMTYNGLGDPCLSDDNSLITPDRETQDMKLFFEFAFEKYPETWKTKKELIEFITTEEKDKENPCRDLFTYLELETRSGQIRFAFLINKYVERVFSGIKMIIKDKTQPKAARQMYKFTKEDKEVRDNDIFKQFEQLIPKTLPSLPETPKNDGNVGNVGNVVPTLRDGVKFDLDKGIVKTSPSLPTLPLIDIRGKPDLYQAIKHLDNGDGAEMDKIQQIMDCSDKDFEEYVSYGKRQGMVFECKRGFLKLL